MLERESLQLIAATAEMEKDQFVIRVRVRNVVDRTVYAYGSPRRVVYDNASRNLTLQLHDHGYGPAEADLIAPHLKQPRSVPLEGGAESEIKIDLAPLMRRIRPAGERGSGALFEELRVSEARQVELEIAHQDTPFYYNPKLNNLRQLQEWGKVVARATFSLERPSARP